MPSVNYGSKLIEYSLLEKEGLKSHYISVEKHTGVVLMGKRVTDSVADRLILKKARWILNKLELVKPKADGEIVTGSRVPYLGKSYYVQVLINKTISKVVVEFNHSKFTISIKNTSVAQAEIADALETFYKEKAIEKLPGRVEKWSQKTGLTFEGLQFRKMSQRWGSCTSKNRITLNTDAVKLPFSLIDYLIVHELVHTKIKDHSKAFWAELSKHVHNWRSLDNKMSGMKM